MMLERTVVVRVLSDRPIIGRGAQDSHCANNEVSTIIINMWGVTYTGGGGHKNLLTSNGSCKNIPALD